jgi:hypothetical protein
MESAEIAKRVQDEGGDDRTSKRVKLGDGAEKKPKRGIALIKKE